MLGQIITSAVSFMFDEELAYAVSGPRPYIASGLSAIRFTICKFR